MSNHHQAAEIELPLLDITDADREDAQALKIPADLQPDDLRNTVEWWIKMIRWMGSARVCRERQLRTALAERDEWKARQEESFAFYEDEVRQEQRMRERAEKAEAELAAKDARIAELEKACVDWQASFSRCLDNGTGFLARAEAAESRLRAVSEVLQECSDDSDIANRLRAIVEGK